MKITQQELIEFAELNDLQIFGKGTIIISKIRAIQRLINKGLIPKPNWEGGNSTAYWENDVEIKDRIMWLDEQKRKGESYRQMREELELKQSSDYENIVASDLICFIGMLLNINSINYEVIFIKALILYRIGKRDEALKILQSLEIDCKNNEELLFIIYDEIVLVFHNLGNKKMELQYCEKKISIAEKLNDDEKLGCSYCDIGKCIRDTEIDRAFDYFKRSIKFLRGTDSLGFAYGNMYWVFRKKGKFSEAEECLKKAIELFSKSNDKINETACSANLGLLYYESGRLSEAMKIMKKVYQDFIQLQDLDGEAATIGNIGEVYMKMDLLSKAIENFRHAYQIASRIKNPDAQKVWLGKLSEVYKKMGNIKKSDFYLRESNKFNEQQNSV